jgi:hypothetical protein
VSLRVALLSVDEVRELGGVSDEEDGGVVENPVPVTLLGPELDGEASRVTGSVRRAGLSSDGGKSDRSANFGANAGEKRIRGDITQIVGDLKVSMGSSTLGMNLSQGCEWNTDQIEMYKQYSRRAPGFAPYQSGPKDQCGGSLQSGGRFCKLK